MAQSGSNSQEVGRVSIRPRSSVRKNLQFGSSKWKLSSQSAELPKI